MTPDTAHHFQPPRQIHFVLVNFRFVNMVCRLSSVVRIFNLFIHERVGNLSAGCFITYIEHRVQNVFDNSVTPATLLYLVHSPSSLMWPTCAQKKRKECFNANKSDVWNRLYQGSEICLPVASLLILNIVMPLFCSVLVVMMLLSL
jgi:hypothetical protein